MTVSATPRKAGPFTGNNAQTAFPFAFKVFTKNDIAVILADLIGIETTLVLDSDYSVALNPDQDNNPGGTVTAMVAPPTDYKLAIIGDIDYTQTMDLTNGGAFLPQVQENAADRTVIEVQQLVEQLSRAVQVPVTSDVNPADLLQQLEADATEASAAAAAATAAWDAFQGQYYGAAASDPTTDPLGNPPNAGDLYWNSTTGHLRVYDATSAAWIEQPSSTLITPHLFSGDGVTTDFALTRSPVMAQNALVFIGGVYQRPTTDYTIIGTLKLTLHFIAAPAIGVDNVECLVLSVLPISSVVASNVSVADAGNYYPASDAESALQQLGPSAVCFSERVKPSPFAWAIGRIYRCTTPGQAQHDIDLRREFDNRFGGSIGAGSIYVDPINGLNGSGHDGTPGLPYQSVVYAWSRVGAAGGTLGEIRVTPGGLTERLDLRESTNPYPTRIIADEGKGTVVFRAPGDQPSAMVWTLDGTYTNTWTATPSGSETADFMIYSLVGAEIAIPCLASAAAVEAAGFGWFQDAGTKKIYVRYKNINVSAYAASFEIMYNRASNLLLWSARVYIEGITWRGDYGLFMQWETASVTQPVIFMRNCAAEYLRNYAYHAGGAEFYMQDCTAYRTQIGDGGNYYNQDEVNATGAYCKVQEINFTSTENGQPFARAFDSVRNKQASSAHQDCRVVRINGLYADSYGQNIADVDLAKVWNIGVNCGPINLVPALALLENMHFEGETWLDTVQSAGGRTTSYGLYAFASPMHVFNSVFSGQTADTFATGGATINNYSPLVPG